MQKFTVIPITVLAAFLLSISACGEASAPSSDSVLTPISQPMETPVNPALTEPTATPVSEAVSKEVLLLDVEKPVIKTVINVVPANFLPKSDGFGFQNFGGNKADSRLTSADLALMFGPTGICEDLAEWKKQKRCVGTTTALQFLRQLNRVLENGLCYGMSAMSSRFFAGTVDPTSFQNTASSPFDLDKDATIKQPAANRESTLSHQIAYWHAIQFTAEARAESGQFDMEYPSDVIRTLAASLQEDNGLQYSLGMYSEHGGHAVTPYKVDEPDASMKVKVWFYDNNWPGEERWMELDKTSEEWSYGFASVNLEDADAAPWTGSDVGSLRLVPHYQKEDGYECFFCKGERNQSQGTGSTILLNPDKLGKNSGLLIVDELGRRLGIVDGIIVNEIPGASYEVMPAGDTLLSAVMVSIPAATENYEIQLVDIMPFTQEANNQEYFSLGLGKLQPGKTIAATKTDQTQNASILIVGEAGPLTTVEIEEDSFPEDTKTNSSREREDKQSKPSSVVIKIEKEEAESIVSINADVPTKVTQTLNQSVVVMANRSSEKMVSVFSKTKLEELEVRDEETQEIIIKFSDVKNFLSTPVDKFGDTESVVIKRSRDKVVDIVFADSSAAIINEKDQSINAVLADGTLVNSQLTDTGDRVASYSDGSKQVIDLDGTKVFEDKTGIIVVEKTTGERELFKPTEDKDIFLTMKIEDSEKLDLTLINASDFELQDDLQKEISNKLGRVRQAENLFDDPKEVDSERLSEEEKQLLEALDKFHAVGLNADFILHTLDETAKQDDIKRLVKEATTFAEERHELLEDIDNVLSADSSISEAKIIAMLMSGEGMTKEEAWRLLDEKEVVDSFQAQEISIAFDRMLATGLTEDEVIESMKAQLRFDDEEIKEIIREEQLSLMIEDALAVDLTEEEAIRMISQRGEFSEDEIKNVLYEDELGFAFYRLMGSGLTEEEAIEVMSKDSEIDEEQLRGVLRKEELGFDVYHLIKSGFSTEESFELMSGDQFDEEELRIQLREKELAFEVYELVTLGSSKKDILETILDQGEFTKEEIRKVIQEEELHTEVATMGAIGLTGGEIWRVMKEKDLKDDPLLMMDKMLAEGTSHTELWTLIREEEIEDNISRMRSSGMSEEQVQLRRMMSEKKLMDELDDFKTRDLTEDDITVMVTKQEIRRGIETMQLAGLDQKEIIAIIGQDEVDEETLEELLDETWLESDVDQLRDEGVSDDALRKIFHESQLRGDIEELPETLRESGLLQLLSKATFSSEGMSQSEEQEELLTKMKDMKLEELNEIDSSLIEAYTNQQQRRDSRADIYEKSYDIFLAKVALLEQSYKLSEIDRSDELAEQKTRAYDEYKDMVSEVEQSYEEQKELDSNRYQKELERLREDQNRQESTGEQEEELERLREQDREGYQKELERLRQQEQEGRREVVDKYEEERRRQAEESDKEYEEGEQRITEERFREYQEELDRLYPNKDDETRERDTNSESFIERDKEQEEREQVEESKGKEGQRQQEQEKRGREVEESLERQKQEERAQVDESKGKEGQRQQEREQQEDFTNNPTSSGSFSR